MTTKEEQPKTQAQKDYAQGQEFIKNDEIAQAAAAFHNAMVGFEQDGDENGIANCADKMGDICLGKKEFDKALAYYGKAYDICTKNFDRYSLFCLERKKAKVYETAEDFQKAIAAYVEVVDEYNALRDPQGAVDTLETLAGIYLKVSDKEMAADCYRTIASIHKNYKHNNFYNNYMEKAAAIMAS